LDQAGQQDLDLGLPHRRASCWPNHRPGYSYCVVKTQQTVAGGASDEFAHVFDSASGTLPSHYVWAFEGLHSYGIQCLISHFMSHLRTRRLFSPDGWYLAYGGAGMKITLWTIGNELADGMQQDILPKSPSSSSLNVSIITFHSLPCSQPHRSVIPTSLHSRQ